MEKIKNNPRLSQNLLVLNKKKECTSINNTLISIGLLFYPVPWMGKKFNVTLVGVLAVWRTGNEPSS